MFFFVNNIFILLQVVDPWGEVLKSAKDGEEIIYTELDMEKQTAMRQQIPVQFQKRDNVYRVTKV